MTTVQDLPGRVGYWHVGVPPSGPMDDLVVPARQPRRRQRRAAPPRWRCTGGGPDAAVHAPRGDRPRRRGRCRSPSTAWPVPCWAPVAVAAGAVARPRRRRAGPGLRAYLAVRGGIDVPRLPRQPLDVHARRLRRPRRPRRCAPATCCPSAPPTTARPRRPLPPGLAPALASRRGRSACSTARTPRPTSSPPTASTTLLRDRLGGALQLGPHRRAPDRAQARAGRAPTAARPACTRRTSTTRRTRSARSTSPATCRSSSAPTARASAASCARPSWPPPSGGSSASSAPGDTVRFVPCRRRPSAAAPAAWLARADRAVGPAAAGPPRSAAAPADACCAPRRDRRRARRSPTGAPATATCSSSTGRWCSTSTCACASTRSTAWVAEQACAGVVDADRRASARCRCRSTADALTVDGAARRAARAPRTSCRRRRRRGRSPAADRAPAAVVGRPGDPRGDRALHARRARRRAVVPVEHRVHPPHQRPRPRRRRAPHRLRRRYLVLGLGDVYLGAPVATPLDPAPPPGHHEVQPGAHLDAGERGRHRRRLPVHLRHGGPGGYQFVGRTVQVWNRDRRGPHFDQPVAAALLRPDPLPSRSSADELLELRASAGRRRAGDRDRADARSAWPTSAASCADARRRDRAVPSAPAGGVRRRARAWAAAGSRGRP